MKKNLLKFVPAIALIFASSAMATEDIAQFCQQPSFLSDGFDMANYEKCSALIKKCPMDAIMPQQSCVDKITTKNPSCKQFKQLADNLQMPASLINVKSKNKVALVDVLYPGDGQKKYYLISSEGCLIDTQIDPRKLDESLDKKYHKTEFMMTNWDEPKFKTDKDETEVTALLKITDTCLACKVVGWAKIKLDFTKEGKFDDVDLESFSKKNKK